ncbi:MAG: hypothetical protein IBJ09_13240 [Bacteroidia bacterium]|nr:hypothetical protein [Bacteroidia bacterium]
MKSIRLLPILVLISLIHPRLWGQADSCTVKLNTGSGFSDILSGTLVLNGKDTVRTDSNGVFRHPLGCRLRKITVLQLDHFSNGPGGRKKQEASYPFAFRESYESDDTLFIMMAEDRSARSLNTQRTPNPAVHQTFVSYSDALNIQPGIRWEYRGLDGSAVLNVRGSGLRNQFGIRNVKFYHNGMPLTYSDGFTPFEMTDPLLTGRMELNYNVQDYGAGNGGVLRIYSPEDTIAGAPVLHANLYNAIGSFGYRAHGGTVTFRNKRMYLRAGFAYKQSKGYRDLEFLNRKNADAEIGVQLGKKRNHTLSLGILYSYINWGLPGSLNAAQADTAPRMANPFSLLIPAHLEKSAGKGNIRYTVNVGRVRSETMLFGGASDKYNPYGTSFFNNGIKTEKGFNSGLLQTFDIRLPSRYRGHRFPGQLNNYLKVHLENQNDVIRIRETDAFVTDSVKFAGRVVQSQTFGGVSFRIQIRKTHIYISGSGFGHLNFYRVDNDLDQSRVQKTSVFGTGHVGVEMLVTRRSHIGLFVGHSYSPPLWDERIMPNGTILPLRDEKKAYASFIYQGNVQRGTYDAMHRWKAELYSWYYYDFIVPYFQNGSDLTLYRNAGNSVNSGLEVNYDFARYFAFRGKPSFAVFAKANYGFQYFLMPRLEFENQVYTNKIMPGMPMHQGYASVGGKIFGLKLSLSAQYIDRIALNFDNTDHQKAYMLLNAEISYSHTIFQVLNLEVFLQGRNLTNSAYSSRLQLNAPLGRYYNPAPGTFVMGGFYIRTANLIKSKPNTFKLSGR